MTGIFARCNKAEKNHCLLFTFEPFSSMWGTFFWKKPILDTLYKTWQSDYQICLKHLTKAIFHRIIFFLLYCGKGTIITARKPFINRSPTKFSCSVNKSAWRSKPWLEETTERLWIRFIDFEACAWSRKVLFVEKWNLLNILSECFGTLWLNGWFSTYFHLGSLFVVYY